MQVLTSIASVWLAAAVVVNSSAIPHAKPFEEAFTKRQSTGTDRLQVDLGYEIYQGVANATTGLNTFKGYANKVFSRFRSC